MFISATVELSALAAFDRGHRDADGEPEQVLMTATTTMISRNEKPRCLKPLTTAPYTAIPGPIRRHVTSRAI